MKKRAVFFGIIMSCCLLAEFRSFSIAAEPAKTGVSRDEDTGKSKVRRKPLPANYGMIGLEDGQRDQIYAVMDSYEGRLEKLRQEIESLTKERNAKLETFLTSGQKSRLAELREQKATDSPKEKPVKDKPKMDKAP